MRLNEIYTQEEAIHKWIEDSTNMNSRDYEILPDGTINIDSDIIRISVRIPHNNIKFNSFTGNRLCYQNIMNIDSLKGLPNTIKKGQLVIQNTSIISFEGAPKFIWGELICYNCLNLVTLKGISKFIGGAASFNNCPKLTPWEMRYLLFTDINNDTDTYPVLCSNSEVINLFDKYFKNSKDKRHDLLPYYLEKLKDLG